MEDQSCSNCKFWKEIKHSPIDEGLCRRYAPKPSLVECNMENEKQYSESAVFWPLTEVSDWCGEYQEKSNG